MIKKKKITSHVRQLYKYTWLTQFARLYPPLPGHLTLVNKSAGVIRRIFIDNLGKLAKSRQKHHSNQLHTSCYTLHTIPYRQIKFVFNAFHTERLLSFSQFTLYVDRLYFFWKSFDTQCLLLFLNFCWLFVIAISAAHWYFVSLKSTIFFFL